MRVKVGVKVRVRVSVRVRNGVPPRKILYTSAIPWVRVKVRVGLAYIPWVRVKVRVGLALGLVVGFSPPSRRW